MSQVNNQFTNGLKEEINNIELPAKMNFSGIAKDLHLPNRHRSSLTLNKPAIAFASVMLGLILIIFSLIQTSLYNWLTQPDFLLNRQRLPGLLPILSTFFFLLPPFYSTHEASKGKDHQIIVTLITIILWLGEGMLWMLIGLNLIDLIAWLIYLLSQNFDLAILSRIITIFFFALLWLTLIIINAEFHFRHLGHSESWKSFGRTLLISGIAYLISMLILQV